MMMVSGNLKAVASSHLRAVRLDGVATPPLRIISGGKDTPVSTCAIKRFQLALDKNDRLILVDS